ncbi:adhesion G protein-coupled receptor E3-like isoform X2 [Biomphalaria glabrata]|uniref:Adhesion G protein-coupled receptor E3-like isoform X2 n=1 Tax=Biomphalaria glabrata TaxID=6526 RepID=A0A9W2YKJ6_BIOGL|nr:adhesion G protein-coupled receptor E3-like isoform X2 [Biomphalaria glabrata]
MDADIVQACHETNGSKYQIYSFYDGQYYKNIFCYICGTMLYPFEMMDWWCFDSFVDGDMNLYRLLVNIHGRDQESSSKHSVCNDTFWPAPNGDCLQLRCSPGKTLKNGTCVTIFSEICGLVYRVRALLIPNVLSTTINYTTADIMDLAADQMSRRLKNISDGLKYQFGIATDKNVTATNHAVPVLWSDIYILASRQLTRDTFEKIALEIVFRDNAESDFIYINVINKDWFRFHGSDKDHLWLNNVNVDTERMMNSLTIGIENNILLSTVLLCTSITFHKSNYTVAWSGTNLEGNVTVTVDVGGTILTISNMSDMNSMEVTENEELHVCTEVLEKYVNELRKQKEKRPIVMAMNVLTYVCLCASELCLLFTLVTYLGFPELRTVPGINNMFLCLSLLLAQLALVLASNISAPSNLCTGVGLITHFLWLWHFTWSFLCSLHMFQVFTATVPTQSLNGSGKFILVVQLTTVSLVLPVTVVLAVIISSFVTSHTIGYGRLSCYLDTAYLIGLSVVAPICLVSLCCLTFLGITIASIHKVNKILSLASLEMDQYRNCLLYVKLSFVTGVYWIVTIIAEALDSDILWIISLLLNGLQGVAIFVSYMCNKRVYRLYLSKFLSQQTSSLQQTLSVQQTMTSE